MTIGKVATFLSGGQILGIFLFPGANAKPWFSTPNEGCPAIEGEIPCPTACVRDMDDCPQIFQKASHCSDSEYDCGDGTCGNGTDFWDACPFHPCSELDEELKLQLRPCPQRKVAVLLPPGSDEEYMNERVYENCGVADLGDNVYSLADYKPTLAFGEPGFRFLYTVWILFFVLLGLYTLYKKQAERKIFDSKEGNGISLNQGQLTNQDSSSEVRLLGYRNDTIGTAMFWYLVAFVMSWLGLMAATVLDRYTLLGRPKVFKTEYYIDLVFILAWWGTLITLLSLMSRRDVRPFFRIRTPLAHATKITILKKRNDEVIVNRNQQTTVSRIAMKMDQITRRHLGAWTSETVDVRRSPTSDTPASFEYQCVRYAYDSKIQTYRLANVHIGPENGVIKSGVDGIPSPKATKIAAFVGPNLIHVNVASLPVAVAQEFCGLFYLYQMMCLWVWCIFCYWKMALVLLCVVGGSALLRITLSLQARRRIKTMAEHTHPCTRLSSGRWMETDSSELVPGDIIRLRKDETVPCDAVVVQGYVIVDESMLTGESMPVQKFAIGSTGNYKKEGSSRKNTLFSGTSVLQTSEAEAGASDSQVVLAMVESIGAHTDKGKLIRNILFPNRVTFAFNEELKVVFLILGFWGFFGGILGAVLMDATSLSAFFYAVTTISQIISPIVIAMLVVGESVAATRLRKSKIHCLDHSRIPLSGKVRIFCFDKTGTLTCEGLEWESGHPISDGAFLEAKERPRDLPFIMQMCLASAHTISVLGDQLVGPPVDIEMFKTSKWVMESQGSNNRKLVGPDGEVIEVIKCFEFEHALMRMIVAVRDTFTGDVHILCKGSFESIGRITRQATLPRSYDSVAASYARRGCYVLGVAHRNLGPLSDAEILSMSRSDMEAGIEGIGLIMFRNKLKPDTADALMELRSGHIRPVMITGDNTMTGICIARECLLTSSRDVPVYLADVNDRGELIWTDVDTQEIVDIGEVRARSYKGLKRRSLADMIKGKESVAVDLETPQYELAVTGPAFDKLCEQNKLRDMLLQIRIFGRMTPDGKVKCVELHMEQAIVGMCGDGGNDCGALRTAHAGVALSEAEASIVSPFASKSRSIQSCVQLVKEGRCALATSLNSYRFTILYGEIIVFQKLIGFYFATFVSEWTWMIVDCCIMVFLSWALTQAKACQSLSKFRPTARILGVETLATVVGMLSINFSYMLGSVLWFLNDPVFRCKQFNGNIVDVGKWWLLSANYEGEIMAFVVIFQLLGIASLVNSGFEFRRAWWKNWIFLGILGIMVAVYLALLLANPNWLGCVFELNCGTDRAMKNLGYNLLGVETWGPPAASQWEHNVLMGAERLKLLCIILGNFATLWIFQNFVILGPIRRRLRASRPQERLKLVH